MAQCSMKPVLTTVLPTVFLIFSLEAKLCFESLPTIQNVTKCPSNDTELQLAVKRKRCDVLASIQTCVPDPKQFVYHCLLNQHEDGFVEVCAPKWILTGFCGSYDTAIGKIFNNVKKDCTLFDNPCPNRFNSSDSYNYQGCFEIRRDKEKTKLRDGKEQDSPCSSDSPIFWIVPSILAVGFMMAFIYEFIKLQKIQKLADNSKDDQENTDIKPSSSSEQGKLNQEIPRVSENPFNSTNQSDSTPENAAHHMGQSDPAPEGNQNSTKEAASSNAGERREENENKAAETNICLYKEIQYVDKGNPQKKFWFASLQTYNKSGNEFDIPQAYLANSYPGYSWRASNAEKDGDTSKISEKDKLLQESGKPTPVTEQNKKKKRRPRRQKSRGYHDSTRSYKDSKEEQM